MQVALETHVNEGNFFKAFQVLPEYLQLLDGFSVLLVMQEMSRGVEILVNYFLDTIMDDTGNRALQYASRGNHYTDPHSVRQVLEPLKIHGVSDGEMCVIANIAIKIVGEAFGLMSSLKSGQTKDQPVHTPNSFQIHYRCNDSYGNSITYAPSEIASEIQDNNMSFELEKLRVELRHIRGMYAMAQSEAFDASRKLNDLQKQQLEESIKLKELKVKEEELKALAEQQKKEHEAAKRQAEYVKECVKIEAAL
nr:U-box domain-containing protein kinase family protein [Tanacetum cinerariifolium]